MAFRVRYTPSISGTNKIMISEEMAAYLDGLGQQGAKFAEAIAPEVTGEYKRSFTVETVRRGGPRKNRAEARVINTSDHAMAVEYTDSGGHRTLGRTVDYVERLA